MRPCTGEHGRARPVHGKARESTPVTNYNINYSINSNSNINYNINYKINSSPISIDIPKSISSGSVSGRGIRGRGERACP